MFMKTNKIKNNNTNKNKENNRNIKNNKESLLVFEYYTASGITDENIVSEAIAMIKALLSDVSQLKNKDIHFLVSKDFEYISKDFNGNNFKTIVINSDTEDNNNLFSYLTENLADFDGVMFIASEEDNNLYNLTEIIEDSNIKIYGSNKEATKLSSDKYETFNQLKRFIPSPRTFKFTLNDESDWEIAIKNIFDFIQPQKLIAKPLNGVDCQDIVVISSYEDISKLTDIFSKDADIIVQEYIEGEDFSVTLISNGEIAIPLSLNKQYIEINQNNENGNYSYLGGELPYNPHNLHLKERAFEIAKTAILAIPGISGFVGVDLILTENEVYFLEINSRFTTPYVGLNKIANFNIGKTIVDLLDNDLSIVSFIDSVDFIDNNVNKGIDFKGKVVKFIKTNNKNNINNNSDNNFNKLDISLN